jgi:hypothetical protein
MDKHSKAEESTYAKSMNPQTRIRQMMQAMNEQKALEIKQGNDEFKAILNG